MIEFDNLTYLHGKPQGTGLLKANPEDFVVVEDLGFEPDGEGEHILVRILKNGCNTRFVADALAKFLKIHAREVSFAGQKDKHAVTEQWLCARVLTIFPDDQQYRWFHRGWLYLPCGQRPRKRPTDGDEVMIFRALWLTLNVHS